MRRMDKLSNNKAKALLLSTRRRTKVRRVAKFIHSIKHLLGFYAIYTFLTTPLGGNILQIFKKEDVISR